MDGTRDCKILKTYCVHFRVYNEEFKGHSSEEQCDSLTEIVSRCKVYHEEVALKYCELQLNEVSGKYGYISKSYPDIIPRPLCVNNKTLVVTDNVVILTSENRTQRNLKTPLKDDCFENTSIAAVENERAKYKCVYCGKFF